jgi:hypothetical protein
MKLTNDSYLILIGTKNFTERYYRDKKGWLKISARGREFRMTAEQVLNHLLPAVAGVKPNILLKVEHRNMPRPAQPQKPSPDAKVGTSRLRHPRPRSSGRNQRTQRVNHA